MTTPVYSAIGITKRFGSYAALLDVNLDVHQGEIMGIVGANGAGKSTLMRILAGALQPDEGELLLEGEPIRMRSMQEAWSTGIAFVSQELNLFSALSVLENLALVPGRTEAITSKLVAHKAAEMLERLALRVKLTTPLGTLSLAERQLVEIGRALLQGPRVLILDEPTSALQAAETDRLHAILHDLRESGTAIIYISHFIEEMLGIADTTAVLRDGRRVELEGKPTISRVVTAMLGERPSAVAHAKGQLSATGPKLTLENVRGPIALDIPSVEAKAGEIVGLAGLAGSGIEELFALLFGRVAPAAGRIGLPSGRAYRADTPSSVANGVAYVPADRKRLGLALDQSICENVSSVRALGLGRDGFVPSPHAQLARADVGCRATGVKMASVHQPVASLSGGNQQKVVFAKWVEAEPSLLLLDDPMRGVDIGAKRELYQVIRRLSSEERVVLFYSSDASDYVAVTDRVLIFADGRIIDELAEDRLTEHQIVASMNAGSPEPVAAAAGH